MNFCRYRLLNLANRPALAWQPVSSVVYHYGRKVWSLPSQNTGVEYNRKVSSDTGKEKSHQDSLTFISTPPPTNPQTPTYSPNDQKTIELFLSCAVYFGVGRAPRQQETVRSVSKGEKSNYRTTNWRAEKSWRSWYSQRSELGKRCTAGVMDKIQNIAYSRSCSRPAAILVRTPGLVTWVLLQISRYSASTEWRHFEGK
ncbi:hypothetical protein RRG08_022601 [Elysia crispata]|uniref:Uncharacterized protein n=1 Tax=Elysia crispata TaxID=231223 RepID=A0AAE0Z2Y9_9GAST|nr:hypothetical protein RRG08_022601 [Elysia crispata]